MNYRVFRDLHISTDSKSVIHASRQAPDQLLNESSNAHDLVIAPFFPWMCCKIWVNHEIWPLELVIFKCLFIWLYWQN